MPDTIRATGAERDATRTAGPTGPDITVLPGHCEFDTGKTPEKHPLRVVLGLW